MNFATHHVPAGVDAPTEFYGLLDVYTGYATSLTGATATTNVRLSGAGTRTVTGSVTANALLLADGSIVVDGGSLTLNSGLLASTGTGNRIEVATLTLGRSEGNLYTADGADLTITSAVDGMDGRSEVQRLTIGGTPVSAASPANEVQRVTISTAAVAGISQFTITIPDTFTGYTGSATLGDPTADISVGTTTTRP